MIYYYIIANGNGHHLFGHPAAERNQQESDPRQGDSSINRWASKHPKCLMVYQRKVCISRNIQITKANQRTNTTQQDTFR